MRRKIVRTRKKTWKVKVKLDVEDWLTVVLFIVVAVAVAVKIIGEKYAF